MSWLIKFAIAAGLGIFAFKAIGGTTAQSIVTSTDTMNLLTATNYVRSNSHGVVIVGSSLSARLSEGYFNSPQVENLSIAGGASGTGLEIIRRTDPLPKLVVIESNILSRRTDPGLVERSLHPRSIFEPVKWLAGSYERYLHPPKSKQEGGKEVEAMLARPATDVEDGEAVREAVKQAADVPAEEFMKGTLDEINRSKADLEARGVRVLLLHVPCSDDIENAPFATASNALAREAFPKPSAWLKLELDRSQLRWTDGVHLDERSAALVARAIDTVTLNEPKLTE
ncbi:hypothetical protein [Bradyrhizobium betae]|uniref:SGNH/GDSL hydrolase family protein n=1 Tax=Bradyrhizobium betae TaxID=244734 RepID=A0A4Q1VE67_9BRAD|nr:hypothetical protein [Bradyrhizobium betae]RXT48754.1 hypothetical protein B5V03_12685 [Bradyrhizobium betae]